MSPVEAISGTPQPSFRELTSVFGKIGLLSFGGPAGQIALMHRMLVDERRWIAEKPYLSALNFCMLLPGPEAMQLATYVGWLLHKTWGGIVAGTLFVRASFAMPEPWRSLPSWLTRRTALGSDSGVAI